MPPRSIATGNGFTCRLVGALVECIGGNSSGELGLGGYGPSDGGSVVSLNDATSVTAGGATACAISTNGMRCWGSNYDGVLGNNSMAMLSPVPVDNGLGPVTAGDNDTFVTCALLPSGAVWCWGSNMDGELGTGAASSGPMRSPVVTKITTGAAGVAVFSTHSCVLLESGTVKCWGDNAYGQLGDNSTTSRLNPVAVRNVSQATQVAAGDRHSCAVAQGGEVWCWGWNRYGQLGDGTTTDRRSAVRVQGLDAGAVQVEVSFNTTCARMVNGRVKCWGGGNEPGSGLLGDGTTDDSPSPVDVLNVAQASDLDVEFGHACASVPGGTWCWGKNSSNQLGAPTPLQWTSTPVFWPF